MAHQPVGQEHDGAMQLPRAPDYESCQDLESECVADAGEECNAVLIRQHADIRPFAEDVGMWIFGSMIGASGVKTVIVHDLIRDPFCFGHLNTPFCEQDY